MSHIRLVFKISRSLS